MISALACDHLREDHREMEKQLDRLLLALLHLTPELVAKVQSTLAHLHRLEWLHFEKEEGVFYPRLRPAFPDLLVQMDLQHEEIREVERHVAELLANPPDNPDHRWLDELRRSGIELHDRIQHHIVDEEDQLFRLADGSLTQDDQKMLAGAFETMQNRIFPG